MKLRNGLLVLLSLSMALLTACAKQIKVRCPSPEDNPSHHYLMGMEALDKGDLTVAGQKFERARYCNESFAPTYAGLTLVEAHKARSQTDPGYRQTDVQRSLDLLGQANKLVASEEDRFIVEVTNIQIQTALKEKVWHAQAEESYTRALASAPAGKPLLYYQGKDAAHYFMGLAYLEAREFTKARDSFRQALEYKADSKWHQKADAAWKRTDRIVRAMAGVTVGNVGKEIAVKEEISRADLAALLVDELKVDQLFAGRIPIKASVAQHRVPFTPADMVNHPFKEEVLTLMKWNIRGLEPQFDPQTRAYLFQPDAAVARKELAIVLEDVLIKLTGNDKLASAFLGQEKSPFPDVDPTAPWYNAVVNAVTRGLMETELSGEFRPDTPADGAEVMLAVRGLKR
jgi:tetratricopeptide (TPR) repeat protein